MAENSSDSSLWIIPFIYVKQNKYLLMVYGGKPYAI